MIDMIERLIGAAAVSEAPTIAGILSRAFGDVSQQWSAESVAAMLAVPGSIALLTHQGCALLRIVADEAELLTIARDPVARGQGVGARLLDTCLAEAGLRGASRLYLEVAAGNTAAIGLYRGRGFICAGRRPGYYMGEAGAEDALLMSCEILPAG